MMNIIDVLCFSCILNSVEKVQRDLLLVFFFLSLLGHPLQQLDDLCRRRRLLLIIFIFEDEGDAACVCVCVQSIHCLSSIPVLIE